jgi:hypothetical protein
MIIHLGEVIDKGCMKAVKNHLDTLAANGLDKQGKEAGLSIVNGNKTKKRTYLLAQIAPVVEAIKAQRD